MTAPRIVIVEDEPITLQALRMIVMALGCEVLTASTAEEGLELALQTPRPDAALVDLKLRGSSYDGLELIRRLVKHPVLEGLRVLAHTASVSEDQRRAAQQAGAHGILLKPFRARDVAEALGPAVTERERS
ncbi:MAG: response regulator [Candidatus Sericytochromatia bacterium]|nr:response regulator [Candidatus Tanganyikabacteria bacterium]